MTNRQKRIQKIGKWAGLFLLAALAETAYGQMPPDTISTDRPDLTEGSSVVGAGRFQIETSGLYEVDKEGADTEQFLTPTLLRLGATEKLELRMESDGFSHLTTEGPTSDEHTAGYSPISLGMKYRLHDEGKRWSEPALSLLGNVTPPSGSGAFALDKTAGEARLLMDWTLTEKWGLGANLGVGRDIDDENDGFIFGIATLALARSWTDRLGTFWEIVYQAPESSEDDHAFLADTGVTYLITNNAQFDVAVGSGVTGEQVPDFFVTSGISLRF